jgi:hypothetical protein
MPSTTLQTRHVLAFILVLFSAITSAAEQPKDTIPNVDVAQLSATETYEKWGQVLFCQRIYTLPQVRTRLYDFDVEHCDQAGQLALDVVSKYSEQEQQELKYRAEQHAQALSYNSSEPYHSVGACREYCRKLAEYREQRNDQ